MRDATTHAYVSVYVLRVISIAIGVFFTYQVKEAAKVLLNLPKDSAAAIFFG